MRDKDTLILENLYIGMLFEFTEKTIQKLIAKFQKEKPDLSEDIIKGYLERFEQVKSSPRVKKKDPFQYKWDELENFLDANFPTKEEKTLSDDDLKEKLKVYEDSEVIVYHAKNARDTQILGEGFTFCISRMGTGNMYSYYRLNYQSNFYFIRFKNKTDAKKDGGRFENPLYYIVLDINADGRIQYTGADNGGQGNGTKYISEEELFEKFPELKKPFDEKIFEAMPLTKEEKEKYEKFKGLSSLVRGININEQNLKRFKEHFSNLKYQEKREYLQSGYEFPEKLFSILDKELRGDYLNNAPILSGEQVESLSESETKRWITVYLRSNEMKHKDTGVYEYLMSVLDNGKKDIPEIVIEKTISAFKKGSIISNPYLFLTLKKIDNSQIEKMWEARLSNGIYLNSTERDAAQKYLPKIYEQYLSIIDVNAKLRLANNNFDNMEKEELDHIIDNKLANEEQLLSITAETLLPNAYTDFAANILSKIDYKKHIPRILDIFDQQTFKYENDKIYFQEWQGDFGSFLEDIQGYVDQDDYKTYLPYYIGDEYIDINVPYDSLDSYTIQSFLNELREKKRDLYNTLNVHMRLLYKERNDGTTAEDDGYDLEDLINQDEDEDIKLAFFRAYVSAMEIGASNGIYKEFQSFVKKLPFNYDEGEGGSVRGYLTPEQFYELLVVPESLEQLYNGENVLEILKQEGEFPKFDVPYNGFDGYDEEAGLETLIDGLEEALS
jgi:hypothetical protein